MNSGYNDSFVSQIPYEPDLADVLPDMKGVTEIKNAEAWPRRNPAYAPTAQRQPGMSARYRKGLLAKDMLEMKAWFLSDRDKGYGAYARKAFGNDMMPKGTSEDNMMIAGGALAERLGIFGNAAQWWLMQGKEVPNVEKESDLLPLLAREFDALCQRDLAKEREVAARIQNAEREKLQALLDYSTGRDAASGDALLYDPDVVRMLPQGVDGVDAMKLHDLMGFIRKYGQQQMQDGASSIAIASMEWMRDAVLDFALNEDGTLNADKWEYFKMAARLYASELQGSEAEGNAEFGEGHRVASAALKWATDFGAMTENVGAIGDEDRARRTLALADAAARGKAKMVRGEMMVDGWKVPSVAAVKEARKTLAQAERFRKQEPARREVAGFLREMSQKAERIGDEVAWYRKGMFEIAEYTPSTTALVLSPFMGGAALFAANREANFNANMNMGMDMTAANRRATQDAAISSVVEAAPGSAIGGKGLSQLLRMFRKPRPQGALANLATRAVASKPGRVVLGEIGVGFVDEAVFEPTAQGVLTLMSDYAFKSLELNNGPARTWAEAFGELKEIWNAKDPSTLVAVAFFAGAVAGVQVPGIMADSREAQQFLRAAAHDEGVWQAMGLSDKAVQQVAKSDNPLAEGQRLLGEELVRDREGVKRRMQENGARLYKEGFALKLTGTSAEGSSELNEILAIAYRELVENGEMPRVERIADRDGAPMYRISERVQKDGKDVVDEKEFNAAETDNLLQLRMMAADARAQRRDKETIYGRITEHAYQLGGAAVTQALEEHGEAEGLNMQDMGQLGGGIGQAVQEDGVMSFRTMQAAAERLKGIWDSVVATFRERAGIAGLRPQQAATRAFRVRTGQESALTYKGRTVYGDTIMHAMGHSTPLEMMEEALETRADIELIQTRVQELLEVNENGGMTAEQAERIVVQELGDKVRAAREVLREIEPDVQISEVPQNPSKLQVIEALSDMGRSYLMGSSAMPAWVQELHGVVSGALKEVSAAVRLVEAAKRASQEGKPAWKMLEELFDQMNVSLGRVFRDARVDNKVAERVRLARAIVRGDAEAITAAEAQEQQQTSEQEDAEKAAQPHAPIEQGEAEVPQETDTPKPTPAQETAEMLASLPGARVPDDMQGVFVDESAVYDVASDSYTGIVRVADLRDSKEIEQVKVGAKGKHGVIEGRKLVGEYNHDAPPIMIWMREDGTLEVISGRHRFALALETGTEAIRAQVYRESATHDAKWARLLDYENNMRDDQADELTAAIYTRETGFSDAEMTRKGLTRGGSKSKRGILIGREARQELWDRFVNGAVSAKDAEIICLMTQGIRDKARVDEIQRRCCMLQEQGKSWEYISAMVQLMASKESVFMKQGLLDLGADFEADMERAAQYVEKCVQELTRAIGIIKSGRRLSGKDKQTAERLGQHTTSAEASEAALNDLITMREMYRNIGAYPDLVASASMWDGKTELDPIGMALTRGNGEVERAAAEANMTREEWEEEQAGQVAKLAAAAVTGSLGFSYVRLPASQEELIRKLKKDGSLHEFMAAVDKINGKPNRKGLEDEEIVFGEVSADDISEIEGLPENYDLAGAKHTVDLPSIWHMYRKHCLDSFFGEKQVSVSFDDIRMIPDIVRNRDSVVVQKKKGKQMLVYTKQYGDLTYKYFAEISRVRDATKTRNVKFKTGWIEKTTGAGAISSPQQPQPTSGSRFPRTATILPLEEYIKQNFPDEAKKIVVDAYKHDRAMLAPNGAISNLEPAQWVAVRLASFKAWFGDWENDPKNASKVLDENGEPLVVYHGTPAAFTVFKPSEDGALGAGIYTTAFEHLAKGPSRGGNIMHLFLNMRNPYEALYPGGIEQDKLIAEGYDGVYNPSNQYYVAFNPVQVKSATDNRGTFDPQNPNITFSIISIAEVAKIHLRRRADEEAASDLIARWDKETARLQVAAAGEQDGTAQYAMLLSLLESTRQVLPPKFAKLGRLTGLMKWAAVYAHMVSTGEVKHSALLKGAVFEKFAANMQKRYEGGLLSGLSEAEARAVLQQVGERKLEDAMVTVARKCREQLELFVKARAEERVQLQERRESERQELAKTEAGKLIGKTHERAYPKKETGRKSPRGKMDTEHYHGMEDMRRWMDATAEEVQDEVKRLTDKLAAIDASEDSAAVDTEERALLEADLLMVQTFGNWDGMTAEQAQAAADAFVRYVQEGREVWKEKLDAERAKLEGIRSRAVFTKNDDDNARREEKKNLTGWRRMKKAAAALLTNLPQFLLGLQNTLGARDSFRLRRELADANKNVAFATQRRQQAYRDAVLAGCGSAKERDMVKWLNELNREGGKKGKGSGIFLRQVDKRRTVSMSFEEASRWVEMTPNERAEQQGAPDDVTMAAIIGEVRAMETRWAREDEAREQRHALRDAERAAGWAAKKRTEGAETRHEASLAREQAERAEAAQKRAARRREAIVRAQVLQKGKPVEFTGSRDSAANLMLIFEQRDYWHLIEQWGMELRDAQGNEVGHVDDPAFDLARTLQPLYDYVGKDGRRFAYALRSYVMENGRQMQLVYEDRMGVPFTLKVDYWRGNFDLTKVDVKDALQDGNGVYGGNAYGMLIDRVHHYEMPNSFNTASGVFMSMVSLQDSYTYMSHIPFELRQLLSDKDFARRLKLEMGEEYYAALLEWIKVMELAPAMDARAALAPTAWMRFAGRGLAIAALGGNQRVLMKQVSGVLHGVMGGEVPVELIEANGAGAEFAWRKIGVAEYAAAEARVLARQGAISIKEMLQSDWFVARLPLKFREVAMRMGTESGHDVAYFGGKLHSAAMDAIDWTDRSTNMTGMLALADAVYRDMEKLNKENALGLTEAYIKQEALASVGRALELAAQPKAATQRALVQARAGFLGGLANTLMMFRSEVVNKLGLSISRAMQGDYAAAGWYLGFGAVNALVSEALLLLFLDSYSDDEDAESIAKRMAVNTVLGDLTAVPLFGDIAVGAKGLFVKEYTAQRSLIESYLPLQAFCRSIERMWEGKKRRKKMDWHDYFVESSMVLRHVAVLTAARFGSLPGALFTEVALSAASVGNAARSGADWVDAGQRYVEAQEKERKRKERRKRREVEQRESFTVPK